MGLFHVTAETRPRSSAVLRAAARMVAEGKVETACGALSALLPRNEYGDAVWWHVKRAWLHAFLPEEGDWEARYGWWKDREPRVIGMLTAAAMAEAEDD